MRLKKMGQITILSRKLKYARVSKQTWGNLILFRKVFPTYLHILIRDFLFSKSPSVLLIFEKKNPSYTFIKSCCIRKSKVSCLLLSAGNSNHLSRIVIWHFLAASDLMHESKRWYVFILIFSLFLIGNPEELQKNFEAISFFRSEVFTIQEIRKAGYYC